MLNSPQTLEQASRLRNGVLCKYEDGCEYHGRSHSVYKIVFEDSIEWAARVGREPSNWVGELRAIKNFQHIKQHRPTIKAPALFFDENYPVLYSEWIHGEPLAIWNHDVALIQRQRLLGDLADFLLQLWTVPALSTEDSPTTYSTWLRNSLDRGLKRTLAGTARWGDAIDYLIMRSMIPGYAEQFDAYPGLRFAHGDLNAQNILVDSDFHLKGVADWDWMHAGPLAAVIHHPWFMADVPGWKNDGVKPGETFEEDRRFLEYSIKAKEVEQGLASTVSELLASSKKRFFFQSAFHFRDIHENFVRLQCPRTEENLKAADVQLTEALELYPESQYVEGARRVRAELQRLIEAT